LVAENRSCSAMASMRSKPTMSSARDVPEVEFEAACPVRKLSSFTFRTYLHSLAIGEVGHFCSAETSIMAAVSIFIQPTSRGEATSESR
jgi:hypothetical protein